MTENEFLQEVVSIARDHGWLVHITTEPPAKRGKNTANRADRGFPSLVLAREGMVRIVHLKSDTARLTTEQTKWQHHLFNITGWYRVAVWQPSDLDDIRKDLE